MNSTERNHPVIRLILSLVFGLWASTGLASAADIELSGQCGWEISGTSINLIAGRVENNSTGGSSGTLRLQLWATDFRYSGSNISGYVLGTRVLGTLQGGYSYNSISGNVSYTAPPSGTYYTTLTVEEYTGSGYVIRDYLTFDNTSTFGGGGGGGGGGTGGGGGGGGTGGSGSIELEGSGSWRISGSTITLGMDRVSNGRSGGSSGTLRMQVWATDFPYSGGQISGYILGTYSLGTLTGGYSFTDVSGTVSYTAPPSGTYYTTLTLEEYGSGSYSIVDYLTFSGTSTFGGGGGGSGGGGGGGTTTGSLDFVGSVSYGIKGRFCNLKAERISNSRTGSTGTLRLRLWATRTPYSGGTIKGSAVALRRLGTLKGGFSFNSIAGRVKFKKPPRGIYYMTLTLEEYQNGRYYIVDYVNLSKRYRSR